MCPMTEADTSEAVIEELQERVAKAGLSEIVELRVSAEGNGLALDLIRASEPGNGHADRVLVILARLGDESQRDILLVVHALEQGTDEQRLRLWYERHGFHDDLARGVNAMRRPPKRRSHDA